ncbi:MAG: hypothetical protein ACK52I_22220 [Pseudomonadota bacterium]|jgi:hypothetical protein
MNAVSLVKKYNSFNGKLVDYQELDTFYHQVKDVVCVVGKGTEHDKIVRLIQNRVGKTLKIIGKDKVRLLVTPLIIPQTKPTKKVKLPSESSGKKKVKIASVPGVKASVSQAIADLVKAKPEKYGKKAMAMQLLYSKFKDADTAELEDNHFITKMLEKQQWIEFEKSGNVYSEYSITSDGKKVLESIKERINSLQVKKQGGELFENLNGSQKQVDKNEVPKPSTKKEAYAVDASVLAGIDFKQYKLTGRWKSELGDFINSDNQLMFWGMPGHGKTVLQLQLAQYFAEVLSLDTLYIANEEFKRSTLADKIKRFKIGHPKLKFAKTIDEKEISKYQVVFFDSINSLGMTLKDYLKFRERHSDKVFVLVVQSTKDGNFRGGQEWEHEVDIAGEVINRKLTLRKHRLDPNLAKKAEQMAMKAAISEAKKKKEIRQAISNKSTKEIKTVTP